MPARDGTGPFGSGQMGRRLGPCGGNEQELDFRAPFGMGRANRWGQRRFGGRHPRWGMRANAAYASADSAVDSEVQNLQKRQNWLKEQLDAVTREIEDRT